MKRWLFSPAGASWQPCPALLRLARGADLGVQQGLAQDSVSLCTAAPAWPLLTGQQQVSCV